MANRNKTKRASKPSVTIDEKARKVPLGALSRLKFYFRDALVTLAAAASIFAVWPQIKQLFESPATAIFVAPRFNAERIEKSRMISLDKRFDQRFFYQLDRTKVGHGDTALIQFPFTLSNVGDKRLEKVTVVFEFTHLKNDLISDPPPFNSAGLGFILDSPMNVRDFTGRKTYERKKTEAPDRVSVSYNLSEILPNEESSFEFHFIPAVYPARVLAGGAVVEIAAYEISLRVISESLSEQTKFQIFVLPAESVDDFREGVKAFSTLLNCQRICPKTWYERLPHKVGWLASRFTTEVEDVSIIPTVLGVDGMGTNAFSLRSNENTSIRRYALVLGAQED